MSRHFLESDNGATDHFENMVRHALRRDSSTLAWGRVAKLFCKGSKNNVIESNSGEDLDFVCYPKEHQPLTPSLSNQECRTKDLSGNVLSYSLYHSF